MSGTANTIVVEPANGQQRVIEREGAGIITPGQLVKISGTGTWVTQGAVEANVGAVAGENIADAGGIEDTYADGDRVRGLYPQHGDLYNLILADGQTITVGDSLEAVAGGQVGAVTSGAVIGFAEESITTSGGTSRILVRMAE